MIDILAAAAADAVNTGVSAGGVAGIAAASGVGGAALTLGTLLIKRGFSFRVGDEKPKNGDSKVCPLHADLVDSVKSLNTKMDRLLFHLLGEKNDGDN